MQNRSKLCFRMKVTEANLFNDPSMVTEKLIEKGGKSFGELVAKSRKKDVNYPK